MRVLLAILAIIPLSAFSEECLYDESAFTDFAADYLAANESATFVSEHSFSDSINGYQTMVTGGGCHHLGYSVTIEPGDISSEPEFLSLLVLVVQKYGHWIGYGNTIEQVVNDRLWQRYSDGAYLFDMDGMAVFVGNYTSESFFMEFYLN